MKRIFTSALALLGAGLFSTSVQAQSIYGATTSGASGAGSIFKLDSAGKNAQIIQDFMPSEIGAYPSYGMPVLLGSRLYFTVETNAGSTQNGALFAYDINTGQHQKVDFSATVGQLPQVSPIRATNGKLYGTTLRGCTTNKGGIYEFDPSTGALKNVVHMSTLTGASAPSGALIETSPGIFYGTTFGGGDSSRGMIFKYNLQTRRLSNEYSFRQSKGYNHSRAFYMDGNKLYGVMRVGGKHNKGTLFKFNMSTKAFTVLHHFSGPEGATPNGQLAKVGNKLYGNTYALDGNRGGLFSYDLLADTLVVEAKLSSLTGGRCYGGVTAHNNKIYFTPANYGQHYRGTLLEFDIATKKLTRVHSFLDSEGANSYGTPMVANNIIYGYTRNGGIGQRGVLYSYHLSSRKYTALLHFEPKPNGATGINNLMQASNGLMYGTTQLGGKYGKGVIYSVDPVTDSFKKLYDLKDSTGFNLFGRMVDANGILYGFANSGLNDTRYGVLYSFNPKTNEYKIIEKLEQNKHGYHPQGHLILAKNGNLYGLTRERTNSRILEYTPGEDSVRSVFQFADSIGRDPMGSLVEASNGKMYGFTNNGGDSSSGVFFEFDVSNYSYKVIQHLSKELGQYSQSSLVEAPNGTLYGVTYRGGSDKQSRGTLVSYNLNTKVFKRVQDFKGVTYGYSQQTPIMAKNGKMYLGTGSSNIIEIDPQLDTMYRVSTMNSNAGRYFTMGSFAQPQICNLKARITQNAEVLTATDSNLTYQWINCDSNDAPIAGATSRTFTATKNGNYAVVIVDGICNDTSECAFVNSIKDPVDGVEEYNQANVSMYPNPVNDVLTISSDKLIEQVNIYNMAGVQLKQVSNSNEINMSEFPAGMYLVEVKTQHGGISHNRIMVSK